MIELTRLDAADEWVNGAYDEEGNPAVCDRCGTELRWHPIEHVWYCEGCGQELDRKTYFGLIGANSPGRRCMDVCDENYPFCKKYCDWYTMDPHDPMLI